MPPKRTAKTVPSRFGWKQLIREEHQRQWLALFKAGVWLLLLVLIGSVLFEIWRAFRQSQWDGKRTFYLVVQTGETSWLAKLDKQQEEVYVGQIPGNTLFRTAGGFGEYQAKHLYRLGEQEGVGGAELIRQSAVATFGLPVQAVIRFSAEAKTLHLPAILAKSLLGFGETNLTRWDRLRLWLLVAGLRQDRLEQFSFIQVPGVSEKQRPDGVTVFTLDQDRLDRWLAQRFTSTELVNDPSTWEVINASGQPGLAAQVGRLLRNTGLQVVQVSEGEIPQEAIFTEANIDPSAVEWFSDFLNLPIVTKRPEGSRSDIVVGVGEEFARLCCGLAEE